MYEVAWRGMWIRVRSKDAQKQLARTSLMDPQGCLRVVRWLVEIWRPVKQRSTSTY